MQEPQYDAIVVGSGISGGWAAKELTEKGLKVLMLERGKNIEHVKDYTNATKAPWEYPHRGGRTKAMEADYPVLKRDYNQKRTDPSSAYRRDRGPPDKINSHTQTTQNTKRSRAIDGDTSTITYCTIGSMRM